MDLNWMVKMAWRDGRRQRNRLLLFMSSIVLGIAALVAISSFGDQLQGQLDNEAKAILGADLEIQSQHAFEPWVVEFLDSLNIDVSHEISFGSMVRFNDEGATRLVNVRAVDSQYPFYGKLESNPPAAAENLGDYGLALPSEDLVIQFKLQPGDSIGIGSLNFEIGGSLTRVPGQSGITGSVAPPVFMPYQQVANTGLLQKGSRVNYMIYGKYPNNLGADVYSAVISPRLQKANLRVTNIEEHKANMGSLFSDITGFLNLTAFVALLLGCLGVASATHLYTKEKVKQVAVLRCLGASGKESAGIYLIQLLVMAFIAAVIGAILGTLFQFVLPHLLGDFLPVTVKSGFSAKAFVAGISAGVVTAMVFALPALMSILDVSPLEVLRAQSSPGGSIKRTAIFWVLALVYVAGFAVFQTQSWFGGIVFTGALVVSLGALAALAKAITVLTRRFMPDWGSFTFRQGLANLFRPNNQTMVLMVTIGLGTGLIVTLLLSRSLLLEKLQQTSSGTEQPNMVLFDIQDDQLDSLKSLAHEQGFPVLGSVPIVNMRLHSLKGQKVYVLQQDSTQEISDRILTREYRVTYRDSLTASEEIIDGAWVGTASLQDETIPVSLEKRMAESMSLSVGDRVAFNVQGAIMECRVGSIRKVDFQRVETNFVVVFPDGVLNKAPKFHVLLTRFDSPETSAAFQGTVVKTFPNISIIDLNLILSTLETVSGKASFVIEFMALISVLTGILVLIASVRTSKYQRIKEAGLLRTLGASRKKLLLIATTEYFLLGSLAALTGIGIALLATLALAQFSFNSLLSPNWAAVVITYLIIVGLVVFIGLLNTRSVVNHSPMQVLKS